MLITPKNITKEIVCEELDYDQSAGNLIWKHTRSAHATEGSVAGCIQNGYVKVTLFGHSYYAHRLIWMMVYGYFPEKDYNIDHINRVKFDNRFENLRVVTRSENRQNVVKANKSNKSGYLGVIGKDGKFGYSFKGCGLQITEGGFASAEGAHSAYMACKRAHCDVEIPVINR